MPQAGVIFDVDGVLLDLTPAEESGFFVVFERRYGLTGLSRDWDSYRIRNDQNIIDEILEANGLPAGDRDVVIADYLSIMREGLSHGHFEPVEIPGARALLHQLKPQHTLGIATSNLLAAARDRLEALDLWAPIAKHARGAEGGGHKRDIVANVIKSMAIKPHRIVYIGDNLNDLDAGLANDVSFIGFSMSIERRNQLAQAGAVNVTSTHEETCVLVDLLLEQSGPEDGSGSLELVR